MAMTSPNNSGLYGSSPPLRNLIMIAPELYQRDHQGIYFSPSLMRFFKLVARLVAVAFPPRQIVNAVRMADLPDPLCPMMKLILSPKLISRRL
jgi:hypothetical protein